MMASLPANLTAEQIQELLLEPAGKPPPGLVSNLQNPSNLDVPVILTVVVSIALATLATLMRTYTKVFLFKSFVYEDCVFCIHACSTHLSEADNSQMPL